MTRHTLHGPVALLAVGCLVVGLALVPAGAGATGTQTANDTTLAVDDATVEPNADTRVRVSLDEVPAGLAGFEVTLELRAAGVANVTGASYPDWYQPTTEPEIVGGRTITLEAADLSGRVQPGATNVTLATVNVSSGSDSGATRLVVTDVQVDADNGSRVAPSLDPGAVTVGSADPPAPATAAESGADDPTTASGSSANDASADDPATDSAADDGSPTGTSTGTGPGLGVGVALAALAALALLARRD